MPWNSETEFSLCLLPMLSVSCASLSVLLKKHNLPQLLLKTISLCDQCGRLQNIIAVQIFQETSCGTLIPECLPFSFYSWKLQNLKCCL